MVSLFTIIQVFFCNFPTWTKLVIIAAHEVDGNSFVLHPQSIQVLKYFRYWNSLFCFMLMHSLRTHSLYSVLETVRRCKRYQRELPELPNSATAVDCKRLRNTDRYCCPPVCGGLLRYSCKRPQPENQYTCERKFRGWCCRRNVIIPTEMPI